jgi:hypothetical protein
MPVLYSRLLSILALVFSAGLAVAPVSAAETDPDGRLFEASADPLADVEQALDRADDQDRLALIVLGGNWCHDSRALAARLNRTPLAEVIEQHYELVYVDAGYLDKGRDVMQQFGVEQYYATPTVLIVDPSTGQLINDEDRHMWANAYNVDMPASVRYFEKWANNDTAGDPPPETEELRRLYAAIDEFERQLADRVDAGYAVVGPMLKAYKDGNPPENFEASWNELRDLRMAIPDDIRALREEAERRVSAGDEDIQLEFPDYPPLSWESD